MPRSRSRSGSRNVIGVAARKTPIRRGRTSGTGRCVRRFRRPARSRTLGSSRAPHGIGAGSEATGRLVHASGSRRSCDRQHAGRMGAARRPAGAGARPGVRRRSLPGRRRRRPRRIGAEAHLVGVDIDDRQRPGAENLVTESAAVARRVVCADALARSWGDDDLRRSDRQPAVPVADVGGHHASAPAAATEAGPYADAAVEFLALAARLVAPAAGASGSCSRSRCSRRVTPLRCAPRSSDGAAASGRGGRRTGSFDADVVVCAIGFEAERRPTPPSADARGPTSSPAHSVCPRSGHSAPMGRSATGPQLNANFRDEYYGLVPAVSDGGDGRAARHQRADRSGAVPVGRTRGALRPPAVRRTARRRRPPHRRGCRPGRRASSCPRCSSPTRQGSSRPSPTPTAPGCPVSPSTRSHPSTHRGPCCRRSPPCSRRRRRRCGRPTNWRARGCRRRRCASVHGCSPRSRGRRAT